MQSAGPVLHEYAGRASCLLEYSAQSTRCAAHATCGIAHTTCCAADAAKGAGYRTPHNRTTCIGTTYVRMTYGPYARPSLFDKRCCFNSRTRRCGFRLCRSNSSSHKRRDGDLSRCNLAHCSLPQVRDSSSRTLCARRAYHMDDVREQPLLHSPCAGESHLREAPDHHKEGECRCTISR